MTKRNLTKGRSMKARPLLLNSERKYKEEIEIMAKFPSENPAPILRLDRYGTVLFANEASKALLQDWDSGIGRVAPKSWRDLVTDVLSSGEDRDIDIELGDKSYTFLVKPIVEGDYVNLYGADMTERKRMEVQLAYKANLLANVNDAVIASDENSNITSWNRAAELIYGWKAEEVLGRKGPELLQTQFIGVEKSEVFRQLAETGEWRGELIHHRKDGKPIHMESASIALRDEAGRITGYVAVNRDITERKKAEEQLAYQASLLANINDAIISSDPQFIVRSWNRAAEEMYGWKAEEAVGRPSTEILRTEFPGTERLMVIQELARTGEFHREVIQCRKDASRMDVEARTVALRGGGEIIGYVSVNRDITERKRMEEELSRSSQFLGSVIENAYVWLDVLDSQHNVLVWNKAAETMSGYSREEVVGHGKVWELLYPDLEYRKQTTENVTDILQSGRTDVDTETRIKRKDGQTRIISWNERALTDQEGKAIGTIAIGHDITERKRAEENLRQSEERYHSLFDRTLDGAYLSTHEGRFVDVNPAFVKMFGYSSKQEMLDITDIKKKLYFSPEERGSHILDTGQEEVEVYRMRRKNGSEVWVEDHGGYVHDEQGNIIYHEGLLRDVTERKRLEDKLKQYSLHLEGLVADRTKGLRESEEKYRDLFEACPVSLWEEDFSAVKQFLGELRQKGVSDFGAYFANHPKDIAKCAALVKVLNMNKATLNLYDAKSVDEIIGGLSGVLIEESNRAFVGEVVALVQGKKYYEAEFENRTLRGETKHCDVICAVVPGYEQSLAKVLVCIVDLTPQKRLEAELVKSQRLAAIGETAAMVGHDLRNPLQGIAGALHLLKQESLTAEERNEMLQVIEKSLHYSDAIVRDLSEYSAEIQLELAEATANSITRGALGAVKVPQNVTIQDLSEDQPTLRVDLDRMKRVFINLIENAIDAMPQGGTLTISSRKSDGKVEIALTDTGSGMPEKVMENLWKPLQTTKAKGLGLGLAICKRIVDAHGGCVSVKSEVGRGTTFTMQLPIRPVEVKQK